MFKLLLLSTTTTSSGVSSREPKEKTDRAYICRKMVAEEEIPQDIPYHT